MSGGLLHVRTALYIPYQISPLSKILNSELGRTVYFLKCSLMHKPSFGAQPEEKTQDYSSNTGGALTMG